MRRLLLFVMGVLLSCTHLLAQNRTITGKVTDGNGRPIQNASVTVTNTNQSVATDANGAFTISVPREARSLTISSVGFETSVITLGASNTVTATLSVTSKVVDEVVITGYQTLSRSQYAGASSKVSEKEIRNTPVASFDQILQGKAPGLMVLSGSGQPGEAANVELRGPTSISGGNSPLYVVDGIPVEAGVFQSINPNDIASVDVLKDASAAAVYGSRGAAGVIVVTTKRGKSGKLQLGFNTQHGIKYKPEFGYDPMNSAQLLEAQEKLGALVGTSTLNEWGEFPIIPGWQYSPNNPNKMVGGVLVPKTQADIDFGNAQLDSLRKINHDWMDEFLRNGTFSNNEITLSGGEGRTRLYSNLGYYKEEGILRPTGMKRITWRNNVDYRDDKLSLQVSSLLGYTRRDLQIGPLNGFNDFINQIGVPQLTPRYITPYNAAGGYNVGSDFAFFAPTSYEKMQYDKVYNDQVKATLSALLTYDFTKNIYAGVLAGIDFRETQNTTYRDPRPFNTRTSTNVRTRSGSMSEALTRFLQPTLRGHIGYRNVFAQDHALDVTVYGEILREYSKAFTGTAFGIDTLRPNTMAGVTAGNAANQLFQSVTGSRAEAALNSVLGIVKYSFQNKYTLNVSYRVDGTSKLPEDYRSQGFYSVGAIWDATKEAFLSNVKWLDVLRVKASYGQSANQENFPLGYYGWRPLYNSNANLASGVTGIVPSSPGNPNADWEYTNTANLGLEFAMFNQRFYGDVQLYDKRTKDLYVDLILTSMGGFGTGFPYSVSEGEMMNRGVEYNLNYDLIRNRNTTVTLFAIGNYNKNEVTSLGSASSFEQGTELVTVGLPLGSHYEVKWAGVDAATGAPLYYTADGKLTSTYSSANRVQTHGTWRPNVMGGFGTRASYKGFEFSILFNYAANTTRVNNMEFFIQNPGFLQQGVNQDAGYTFWTKPGDVARVQSPLYQNQFSSRLIQEADWLRIRSATLAYNFSPKVLGKTKILSDARIYVQGLNLITWTKWRGLDPEDSNNISGTEYPNPRGITAGLELRFN